MKSIIKGLLVSVFLFLYACNGGDSAGPEQEVDSGPYHRFSFVTNSQSNSLFVYARDSLLNSIVLTDTIATGNTPVGLAVHPEERFVYVANSTDSTISQYSIANDGRLTPLIAPTVPTGSQPKKLIIHPSGNYLYSVNDDNSIWQFAINTDGTLNTLTPASLTTVDGPRAVAIDTLGMNLYVTSQTNNTIRQYAIEADGTLTVIPGGDVASGGNDPVKLMVAVDNQLAYVLHQLSEEIQVFTRNTDGTLVPAAFGPFITGGTPTSFDITQSGKYLYVTNGDNNNISRFEIGNDGSLSSLTGPSTSSGEGPIEIAIDARDEKAYVVNFTENTISQFDIQNDGQLTPAVKSKVATGKSPVALSLTASNKKLKASAKFAYVATRLQMKEYRVDNNGALTPITSVGVFADLPSLSAMHPSGRYLYVKSYTDSEIQIYGIKDNGELEFLDAVSVTTVAQDFFHEFGEGDMLMHPSGEFLYYMTTTSNPIAGMELYVFPVSSSGLLSTPIIVTAPLEARLLLHPSGKFAYTIKDTIDIYNIDKTTGALLFVDSLTVSPSAFTSTIDQNGRSLYLYTPVFSGLIADIHVTRLQIEADGTLSAGLTVMENISPAAEIGALNFLFSPHGNLVFNDRSTSVTNQNRFLQYELDSDGELLTSNTDNYTSPLSSDNGIFKFAADAAGRFLYITGKGLYKVELSQNGDFVSDSQVLPTLSGSGFDQYLDIHVRSVYE